MGGRHHILIDDDEEEGDENVYVTPRNPGVR